MSLQTKTLREYSSHLKTEIANLNKLKNTEIGLSDKQLKKLNLLKKELKGNATSLKNNRKIVKELNNERKKTNDLISETTKKHKNFSDELSSLKERMKSTVQSSFFLSRSYALLASAVFVTMEQQSRLRQALKASGLSVEEQDKNLVNLRKDMQYHNLTLDEAAGLYGALADARMFLGKTPDEVAKFKDLKENVVALGKAIDMSATDAVDMAFTLEHLWKVGTEAMTGIGSAMVDAAGKTGLTRQEVQGVVKDLSPMILRVPREMRSKMIPAFLAMSAEMKKVGGDAKEFADMITGSMDRTSTSAITLNSYVSGAMPEGFNTLAEIANDSAYGMTDSLKVMREGLTSFLALEGSSEEQIKQLQTEREKYNTILANAGVTTDKLVKLLAVDLDLMKKTNEELEKSRSLGTSLKKEYEMAQSSLSVSFTKMKNSLTPILTTLGTPLVKLLTYAADGVAILASLIVKGLEGAKALGDTFGSWTGDLLALTAALGMVGAATLAWNFRLLLVGGTLHKIGLVGVSAFKKLGKGIFNVANMLTGRTLGKGIDVLKDKFSMFGDKSKASLDKSGKAGKGFVKSFGDGAKNLSSSLKGIIGNLSDSFVKVMKSFGMGIQGLGKGIGGGLKAILIGLGQGFIALAPGLAALNSGMLVILAFSAACVALGYGLKLATPALKVLGDTFLGFAEIVGGVVSKTIDSISGIVEKLIDLGPASLGLAATLPLAALGFTAMGGGLAALGAGALLAVPGLTALYGLGKLAGVSGSGIFGGIKSLVDSTSLENIGDINSASENIVKVDNFLKNMSSAAGSLTATIAKAGIGAALTSIMSFFGMDSPIQSFGNNFAESIATLSGTMQKIEDIKGPDLEVVSAKMKEYSRVIKSIASISKEIKLASYAISEAEIGDWSGDNLKHIADKLPKMITPLNRIVKLTYENLTPKEEDNTITALGSKMSPSAAVKRQEAVMKSSVSVTHSTTKELNSNISKLIALNENVISILSKSNNGIHEIVDHLENSTNPLLNG